MRIIKLRLKREHAVIYYNLVFVSLFRTSAPTLAPECISSYSIRFLSHIPDPLNDGSPRVIDIDLINLSGEILKFNPGGVVDLNVQRTLGDISDNSYEDDVKLR